MEYCVICEEEFSEDELTYPEDGKNGGYCESCADDNLINCDECGAWLENNYSELDEYITLCESCNDKLLKDKEQELEKIEENKSIQMDGEDFLISEKTFDLVILSGSDLMIRGEDGYNGFYLEEDLVSELPLEIQHALYHLVSENHLKMSAENEAWYASFTRRVSPQKRNVVS